LGEHTVACHSDRTQQYHLLDPRLLTGWRV
jgi:hypothetical protein